jgi:hypothetical protein
VTPTHICRLCKQAADLQHSHIIPAFVAKWLKETSATGFIRFGQTPNKRSQDSYKRFWLCVACEGKLSAWEAKFATLIFHPVNENGSLRVRYGDWFLKFCTSISWRVLLMMREEGMLTDFSEAQLGAVDEAMETWANFMLGKVPHPGRFEQHFLPLDAFEEPSRHGMPANINRSILRTIDLDAVRNTTTVFVLCKMGKFFVLGFVDVRFPEQWIGTKVHVRDGVVGKAKYTLPSQFGEYIRNEAERYAVVCNKISETQREKLKRACGKILIG